MKIASVATIEALRQLRFSVDALTVANSAVCAAQTQIRMAGQIPTIDLADAVQSELKIAARRFRDAFNNESNKLDDDGAVHLHTEVWK